MKLSKRQLKVHMQSCERLRTSPVGARRGLSGVQQSGVRPVVLKLRACRYPNEDGHRVILQESYQLDLKREHAMTDHNFIDPEKFLSDQLAAASPDLLRSMLGTFITALMGAEADSLCGAGPADRGDRGR